MIRCEALTKTYLSGARELTVLNGITFEVEAGGFVAVVGPSGSGKSTLLALLAGLDRATGGRVLHHLKSFGGGKRNAILMSGFQAAGTRGAALLAGQRQLRVGEEMRHALSEILREHHLDDPDLQDKIITVTEVRISPDLRNATAFVMPLGGTDAEKTVQALNRAAKDAEADYLATGLNLDDTAQSILMDIARGDVEIVMQQHHSSWSPEQALRTVEDALTRTGGKVDAILANNSGMALGAVKAVGNAGLAKVFIAGADADAANVNFVCQGKQTIEVLKDIQPLATTAAANETITAARAWIAGSRAWIRASASSQTSTAVRSPRRMRSARSAAVTGRVIP